LPKVIMQFLAITSLLNLLLALGNMLPLGITDGAFVINNILKRFVKDTETRNTIENIITIVFVLIYIIPILIIGYFKGI